MTVNGSYGAYLKCAPSTLNYPANALTDFIWAAPVFSHGSSSLTNNTARVQFTTAGVYAFCCHVHANATLTSTTTFQLQSFYSTDGSVWSGLHYGEQNCAAGASQDFALNGMVQAATNSYINIQFYDGLASTISLTNLIGWCSLSVYRVG